MIDPVIYVLLGLFSLGIGWLLLRLLDAVTDVLHSLADASDDHEKRLKKLEESDHAS